MHLLSAVVTFSKHPSFVKSFFNEGSFTGLGCEFYASRKEE
jgi:hypothetical protein